MLLVHRQHLPIRLRSRPRAGCFGVAGMRDNEITRLCAEAMGYTVPITRNLGDRILLPQGGDFVRYDPLTNDAQAMALVKKHKLCFYWRDKVVTEPRWEACDYNGNNLVCNQNLNHAICECIAKMQLAKTTPPPTKG